MYIVAPCWLFPLYQTQHVGLTAQKVRVFKVPEFRVRVGAEDALLEVGNLMETVHVELADEGAKPVVFEPAPEDFTRETLLVKD